MYRSYDYHSSSYSATDEYLERLDRIERMPSMIADTPYFPNVHEVFSSVYVEENNDDYEKTMSNKKKDQERPHEVKKKVHFVEEDKKTIDMEAEGFIQQKHKGFELCIWDTFKVY